MKQLTSDTGSIISHTTDLKFKDISSESERIYHYPDGSKIVITEPLFVAVSESGAHRLVSADQETMLSTNISHYICPGWNHISWKVHQDSPDFVL